MIETRRRSLVKALSYRFFGVFVTAGVAYVMTRDPMTSLQIGLADTLLKLVAFYYHERLWQRIDFGKPKPPEYQI